VLFGVSLITFLLTYLLPADPARMYAGPNASIETVNSIRHQLGLDRPGRETSAGRLALYCAGRQAGNDVALHGEVENDRQD